jgi:VanZ family protein
LASARLREFCFYWLPPLGWCAVILALSGDLACARKTLGIINWLLSWIPFLTASQIQLIHHYLRKLGHFLGYGILYFLWVRALQGYSGQTPRASILWAFCLSLLLASLDEGHQALVASRTASIRDVALDLGGASLAALITTVVLRPHPKAGSFPG